MTSSQIPAMSVCIPLYMKERFVAETIRSVLAQTFEDLELVIVHNASPDRSGEIAASFDDPRIRLVHNPETVPGPVNVARSIELARAPLVKVVGADDVLYPKIVEKQVAILQDPGIVVVSARQNMIDERGALIYSDRCMRTADLVGRQSRTTVLRRVVRHGGNPLGTYANLTFRRSAYDALGGMPDLPFIVQDLGLAVELLRLGDFYGMEETLLGYRLSNGSASSGSGQAGFEQQYRYIARLRRENRDVVRLSDVAYSAARKPVTRLRQGLIVAAAGPADDMRTRAASRMLGLSAPAR